jgi:hypothetical protein
LFHGDTSSCVPATIVTPQFGEEQGPTALCAPEPSIVLNCSEFSCVEVVCGTYVR